MGKDAIENTNSYKLLNENEVNYKYILKFFKNSLNIIDYTKTNSLVNLFINKNNCFISKKYITSILTDLGAREIAFKNITKKISFSNSIKYENHHLILEIEGNTTMLNIICNRKIVSKTNLDIGLDSLFININEKLIQNNISEVLRYNLLYKLINLSNLNINSDGDYIDIILSKCLKEFFNLISQYIKKYINNLPTNISSKILKQGLIVIQEPLLTSIDEYMSKNLKIPLHLYSITDLD